ncbi:MAG: hypothetical protein Q9177_000441 [Variospora cf. flavescens]
MYIVTSFIRSTKVQQKIYALKLDGTNGSVTATSRVSARTTTVQRPSGARETSTPRSNSNAADVIAISALISPILD